MAGNREERAIAILSFLSEETLKSDLPEKLYAELMAKSDEEFEQVCDNFTKGLISRYTPFRSMSSRNVPSTLIDAFTKEPTA